MGVQEIVTNPFNRFYLSFRSHGANEPEHLQISPGNLGHSCNVSINLGGICLRRFSAGGVTGIKDDCFLNVPFLDPPGTDILVNLPQNGTVSPLGNVFHSICEGLLVGLGVKGKHAGLNEILHLVHPFVRCVPGTHDVLCYFGNLLAVLVQNRDFIQTDIRLPAWLDVVIRKQLLILGVPTEILIRRSHRRNRLHRFASGHSCGLFGGVLHQLFGGGLLGRGGLILNHILGHVLHHLIRPLGGLCGLLLHHFLHGILDCLFRRNSRLGLLDGPLRVWPVWPVRPDRIRICNVLGGGGLGIRFTALLLHLSLPAAYRLLGNVLDLLRCHLLGLVLPDHLLHDVGDGIGLLGFRLLGILQGLVWQLLHAKLTVPDLVNGICNGLVLPLDILRGEGGLLGLDLVHGHLAAGLLQLLTLCLGLDRLGGLFLPLQFLLCGVSLDGGNSTGSSAGNTGNQKLLLGLGQNILVRLMFRPGSCLCLGLKHSLRQRLVHVCLHRLAILGGIFQDRRLGNVGAKDGSTLIGGLDTCLFEHIHKDIGIPGQGHVGQLVQRNFVRECVNCRICRGVKVGLLRSSTLGRSFGNGLGKLIGGIDRHTNTGAKDNGIGERTGGANTGLVEDSRILAQRVRTVTGDILGNLGPDCIIIHTGRIHGNKGLQSVISSRPVA